MAHLTNSTYKSSWLSHRFTTFLIFFGAVAQLCSLGFGQETSNWDRKSALDFLETHCVDCHNLSEASGNLDLESNLAQLTEEDTDSLDLRVWEKVLRRIETRQMPPVDAPRPVDNEYNQFSSGLSGLLLQHSLDSYVPGRVGSMRRLTRIEYQNSIRDLLGLQVDAKEFLPQDESSHGFDNITVEELSPVSLNRYISAAQTISRAALGTAGHSPVGVTIRIPADRSQEEHVPGLPFGTRGGILIQHHFPQTGEYEFEIKLTRDRDEKVEGLSREHSIDVLVDRQRVHQFVVKPPKAKNGDWENRDFTNVDAHLNTRIQVSAGQHDLGVTFPQLFSSLVENKRQPFDTNFNRHRHPRKTPAIFQVSIVGPYNPVGAGQTNCRELIFGEIDPTSNSLDRQHAKKILRRIATGAYRRPITEEELQTPMDFFDQAFAEANFEKGIESAIAAILVNPNFLFRIESDKPADATASSGFRTLGDFELASRLSFFLWSSIPDKELLELASSGKLREQQVLREQVSRMLKDDKSQSLVTNFAAQWLHLRNLESMTPDLRKFPDFDDNLRLSFRRETELHFEEMLRRDKSVLSLIKSNHTYLDRRLATHYGIPNVQGSEFRKVELPDNSRRGGILRHGSLLMVTSYATRTSPTIRGSWILENIIGTPPPPPPQNVPNLRENTQLNSASLRERLAHHRSNPACASCHDLIDPIGFSLENFDAVGRWREFEEEYPINSTGTLPDGSHVASVSDLESSILERPHNFANTMTEKLLTFAIGRLVQPVDGPEIRQIVAQAAKHDFRFSEIVSGIVLSKPFRLRRTE